MKTIKSAVIEIVKELNRHKIDYFITGGTVLYFKKIITETKDLDFIVNYKDFKKLKKIYDPKINVSKKGKNYLDLNLNNIEIEFIGVDNSFDKQSYVLLKNKDYGDTILGNTNVNISTLENLLTCYDFAYKLYNKDKYLERIKLIKGYLLNTKHARKDL
jgi:ribosomal protein RSM22 (predicted rRNA methylase)